jgi:hypothetical protein
LILEFHKSKLFQGEKLVSAIQLRNQAAFHHFSVEKADFLVLFRRHQIRRHFRRRSLNVDNSVPEAVAVSMRIILL